jgi:replication-associated recombination protein RarA
VFHKLTTAELAALAGQLTRDNRQLAVKITAMHAQADAITATISDRAARGLLASLRIAVAAFTEKTEMRRAIILEMRRRAAETEQHQMETRNDEH